MIWRGPRCHRHGRDADQLDEPLRHELGVVDAHAEAESAHATNVSHLVVQRLGDEPDSAVVHRVLGCQRGNVVALPALPRHVTEIDVVVHTEVLERGQQPTLQRLPQAKLHATVGVEPRSAVDAVGSLRGRGQT